MNNPTERRTDIGIFEMARKLGVTEDLLAARVPLGDESLAEAFEKCEKCACTGECDLFLQGEVSATNNKQWWLKGFCPNSKLLLDMVKPGDTKE